MLPVLFTSGALSDPVFFDTVVQHWLLAIDRDRIAAGLSFECPPVCIVYCVRILPCIVSISEL